MYINIYLSEQIIMDYNTNNIIPLLSSVYAVLRSQCPAPNVKAFFTADILTNHSKKNRCN